MVGQARFVMRQIWRFGAIHHFYPRNLADLTASSFNQPPVADSWTNLFKLWMSMFVLWGGVRIYASSFPSIVARLHKFYPARVYLSYLRFKFMWKHLNLNSLLFQLLQTNTPNSDVGIKHADINLTNTTSKNSIGTGNLVFTSARTRLQRYKE